MMTVFGWTVLLTALQIPNLDKSSTYCEFANFRFIMEIGTDSSSLFVRIALHYSRVVSWLLTSHTWLWRCMHEICMFRWFACLYCEIWVFLYAFICSICFSQTTADLRFSWIPDWWLLTSPMHAMYAKVMRLIDLWRTCHRIQFIQQLFFVPEHCETSYDMVWQVV